MRKLLMLTVLCAMSMSFTSCSSNVVVDAKLKIASKVKEVVETGLNKAFLKEGLLNCEAEAKNHGEFMYNKVAKILKVDSESKEVQISPAAISTGTITKSLEGSLAQKACMFAMDKGLPALFAKIDTSSVCLKKLGMVKAIDMGREVCGKIKL